MFDVYAGKTLHGIMEQHQERVRADGMPRTIGDHLILDGVVDLPMYLKYRTAIYGALKVGGTAHHLLGPTYLLAERRGGRQPEGFGNSPPRGYDKLKLQPDSSMIVAELRDIAAKDHEFDSTAPALIEASRAIATLPSLRKQHEILRAPVALDTENRFLKLRVEAAERERDLLRGQAGQPTALIGPRRTAVLKETSH